LQKSNFKIGSDKAERLNIKFFGFVIQAKQNNYDTTTNYFENRVTNASAESLM